jgi:uncharacterized membrane protein (UPF0182 family)
MLLNGGGPASFLTTLRGTRLIVAAFLVLALLVAFARSITGAYVEILWQSQVGYSSAFWTRIAWEWGVRLTAGLLVAGLVYVNLKIASTTLGGIQIRRRFGNLEISEQLPKRYVTWAMLGAAGMLGLWFGAAVPPNLGRQVLLLIKADPWGVTEPVLGLDAGFYVFWVPVLGSAFVYALTTTFLVFTLATAGYAATGALSWSRGRVTSHPLARLHLGVILGVFFLLLAGRLWLGRYLLLLDGNSAVQGIFGYADAEARLPALQTLTVIALGAAGGTVWGALKSRPGPLIASLAAVALGTILIGEAYPGLVQSFRVEPNELERETPYIEYNLDFTRRGFGLDVLERRAFQYLPEQSIDWSGAAEQFSGLPVWTRGALLATYRELEALFPYYNFLDATIDRYPGSDGPVPVALAVRQIDPDGIQDPNWQNLHLRERYVAGMGAVASLASTRSTAGRPEMLIRGIPPETTSTASSLDPLELTRAEIFFGTRVQRPYAVVAPGPGQYLAPDSTPGVPGVDFPEGIRLSSTLRTALLAWRFRDANLLFSSELTDESRLIFRRRAVERAGAVAPFLRFPEAPYPVIADGHVVWVLEAFTGSVAFPLSTTMDGFGDFRSRVAYVRNSFKVTVDAVTGAVELYRVPIDDPLADAYERAYPGLFKPISQMPEELAAHIRYPRELLNLQSRALLQYHQETAPAFHGQQDVWDEPTELAENTSPVSYRPEYGIYRLPGEHEARYQLTAVFVPAGRQNLTSILVARTSHDGVPELVLVDVPVEDQVDGPRQIEALVEQDPQISQQFSLWRTGGSEVWTGHLHVVPLNNRVLYMEPVFLAAEEDAIPELRRFVVSDGERVVMTETLATAAAELSGFELPSESPEAEAIGVPTAPATEGAAAALGLLDQAEARAREGDWEGFGQALEQLRALLERLSGSGS